MVITPTPAKFPARETGTSFVLPPSKGAEEIVSRQVAFFGTAFFNQCQETAWLLAARHRGVSPDGLDKFSLDQFFSVM
jgi:hypothetical protein